VFVQRSSFVVLGSALPLSVRRSGFGFAVLGSASPLSVLGSPSALLGSASPFCVHRSPSAVLGSPFSVPAVAGSRSECSLLSEASDPQRMAMHATPLNHEELRA
jgi:hypothetical protein